MSGGGGKEWWKQGRIAQEEREEQHVVTTLESISLFSVEGEDEAREYVVLYNVHHSTTVWY